MTLLLLAIGLQVAAMLVCLIFIARNDVTPPEDKPAPCTRADPRCAVTARRLVDARAAMVARGIVPLLSPRRPAWPRTSGVVVALRK